MTNALYDLAAHPEFQTSIRNDTKTMLEKYGGWNKRALAQMNMLESSLRESLRLHPVTTGILLSSFAKWDILNLFKLP
jgi:cytochrome P450